MLGGPRGRTGRFILVLLLSTAALLARGARAGDEAKNVILLIADGAGFNAFQAAGYFEHGELGHAPYEAFPVHYGCTTYSLNYVDAGGNPVKLAALARGALPQGYDPAAMWADPNYVKSADPDSAAAATALYTGVKTIDGRMGTGWDGVRRLTSLAQIAHALGKASGVVSSVQASHATPGAMWSHEPHRDAYAAIFNKMVYHSGLDVILGAGHPLFDNHGRPAAQADYRYVGGESTWTDLTDADGIRGFRFIEKKEDFEALAGGQDLPARVVGIAQVRETLQYRRDGNDPAPTCPLNANVPDLPTLARAAINVLEQKPGGFLLVIEGGAVDWANHNNRLGRMVEELGDFNRTVAAVVEWVETRSNWDETLVIVTADHECGMLWGPGCFRDANGNGRFDPPKKNADAPAESAATIADGNGPPAAAPPPADEWLGFTALENRGPGELPGHWYGSGNHTNALVPLWAKGAGSGLFHDLADGIDRTAGELWGFNGRYVDNTDVFTVVREALMQSWVALPEEAPAAQP